MDSSNIYVVSYWWNGHLLQLLRTVYASETVGQTIFSVGGLVGGRLISKCAGFLEGVDRRGFQWHQVVIVVHLPRQVS